MAGQDTVGLTFLVDGENSSGRTTAAFELFLVMALFLGLSGSLLNMAELTGYFPYLLTAIPVIVAWRMLTKRAQTWSYAVLGAAAGLTVLLGFRQFLGGAAAFCNRLFSVSEQRQAYVYDRFAASGSEGHLIFFLTIAGILISVICVTTVKNRLLAVVTAMLCFGLEIYLGVFADAGWTFLLFLAFTALAGYSIRHGKSPASYIFPLVLFTAIAILTILAFPGQNEVLSRWSEAIRDQFDERVSLPDSDTQNPYPEQLSQNEAPGNLRDDEDGPNAQTESEGFLGAHIGTIRQIESLAFKLLLAFLLVSFLYFIARLGFKAWRNSRYRAGFFGPDNSEAIRRMFLYLFARLRLAGLKTSNIDYPEYAEQVRSLTDSSFGQSYQRAVALWQEAVYSDHPLSEAHRVEMRGIVTQTVKTMSEHTALWTKCRLLWFHCFGTVGGAHEKNQ